MNIKIATFAILILAALASSDLDQGTIRLNRLKERSLQTSNRVISFNKADFEYIFINSEST